MGRKVKINWTQLSQVGNNTNEALVNLEKARLNIKLILDSMDEGWKGIDSTAYVKAYYNFLQEYGKEIQKLLEWSEYFDDSSKKYSSAGEEAEREVDTLNVELEEMKDENKSQRKDREA